MNLTTDANKVNGEVWDIAEKAINEEILNKIEDDLDLDEKVSILFLTVNDYNTAYDLVLNIYNKISNDNVRMLKEVLNKFDKKWKDALLEALCIVQNKEIISKLGLCYDELDTIYLPRNRLCSRNFPRAIKCLYMMCENLTANQIGELIKSVRSDLGKYDENLDSVHILELHLLYWIKEKYILLSNGSINLKKLLKHLKPLDDLALIYTDLQICENRPNLIDTYNSPELSNNSPHSFSASSDIHEETREEIKQIEKGLCIIISQMYFTEKYETRFGNSADNTKLIDTFNGLQFQVHIVKNLSKQELLDKLENIPNEFGTDYDCIFVCILSHGCRGTIVASDAEEVSIDLIEEKFCCLALTDVIKVVVVQACQGNLTGEMVTPLATDDVTESRIANIAAYRNFCILMATVQGFVSVRHKLEGSWFIQEFCNVLQAKSGKMTFCQLVTQVIQAVEKKRGNLNGTDAVAQLPELRSCRLSSDFQLPTYRQITGQ